MPPHKTWLIVGCGYVGEAIGALALARGVAQTVIGMRRQPGAPRPGWQMLAADVTQPGWIDKLPHGPIACVIYCAAPTRRDAATYHKTYVEGLRQVIVTLNRHQSQAPRLVFTSSTGVFDENRGGWVNEQTPTPPTSERIGTLLEAERWVHHCGWPHGSVVRFGGIWGPNRDRLQRMAAQRPLPLRAAPHFSNHIHRDDCAGSVVHVASLAQPAPCYVACDHEPVDINALLVRLARAQGQTDVNLTSLPLGAASGKRCDSRKLRQSGYRFRYARYGDA